LLLESHYFISNAAIDTIQTFSVRQVVIDIQQTHQLVMLGA